MLEADGSLRWNSSAAGLSALRELIVEAGFAGFSRLYAPARTAVSTCFGWVTSTVTSMPNSSPGSAEIGARQGRRLGGIARDRDADEILAADQPIGGVELDPARAGQKDLAPGMRRPAAEPDGLALGRRDEHIAGDETRGDANRPGSLDHQDREVAAGPPRRRSRVWSGVWTPGASRRSYENPSLMA